MLKKILSIIDNYFEEFIVVILCSTLVLSLTYTVVVRYAFHTPLLSEISHMAEEVAAFAFVWLLYFGAVLATKKGQHFSITVQFKLLPEKFQRYAFIPGYVGWMLFNLLIIKLGMQLVDFSSEESLAMEIPMKFIYFIIPLSFSLITIRMIQHVIKTIRANSIEEDNHA
ncbi:MAG: TRAP transporter small permease [Proteobacteria bacterium]|nr:TRAP transporter small permease [Pseudomonadota bacterium]